MTYIRFIVEVCRLVGYTKATVDQVTKVYRLLVLIYEAFDDPVAGPEL